MDIPPANVVQITVLGKGIGESVVVHLGDNEWVIIDSFRSRWDGYPDDERPPAPLAFLRASGVDVATQVSAVVLTHLHADHSDGIDEVVQQCASATFSMPSAIPDTRWDDVLAHLEGEPGPVRSKFQAISAAYRLASDARRFHPIGSTGVLDTIHGELKVIGPSVHGQIVARRPIESLDPRAAAALLKENYTSIVLWLEAGEAVALLGADMDRHTRLGWQALLREHARKAWLDGASFVKVPHHGSHAAHEPMVYDRWTDNPVAVLTANRSGAIDLPRAEMLDPLKQVSSSLWLAGPIAPAELTEYDTQGNSEAFWVTATRPRGGAAAWQVTAGHADQQL